LGVPKSEIIDKSMNMSIEELAKYVENQNRIDNAAKILSKQEKTNSYYGAHKDNYVKIVGNKKVITRIAHECYKCHQNFPEKSIMHSIIIRKRICDHTKERTALPNMKFFYENLYFCQDCYPIYIQQLNR
jgi:hypothetical protein